MTYSPRYVDPVDIPVQIRDDYSEEQKLQALEVAESEAELDLNQGESFDTVDISAAIMDKIRTAIKQKATAELVEGAEHPDDVTLGDIDDDGSDLTDYADTFDEQYESLIDKIRNSGALNSSRDNSPYYYTTQGNTRGEGENILGDYGGGSYCGRY